MTPNPYPRQLNGDQQTEMTTKSCENCGVPMILNADASPFEPDYTCSVCGGQKIDRNYIPEPFESTQEPSLLEFVIGLTAIVALIFAFVVAGVNSIR